MQWSHFILQMKNKVVDLITRWHQRNKFVYYRLNRCVQDKTMLNCPKNHANRFTSFKNTDICLFYGPMDFDQNYLGELVPEPIWILLKQETVSSSGVSWAIRKSAPRPREICQLPPLSFYSPSCSLTLFIALHAARPTASKHYRQSNIVAQFFSVHPSIVCADDSALLFVSTRDIATSLLSFRLVNQMTCSGMTST